MNEHQWLRHIWAAELLHHARRKASARKFRLIACAICRLMWDWLENRASKRAVEISELYADRQVKLADLRRAGASSPGRASDRFANCAAKAASQATAEKAFYAAATVLDLAFKVPIGADNAAQRLILANLVRHIVGNPFGPVAEPVAWPAAVRELSETLYAGQDCAFALHDALLEAGHPELAEHFQEQQHPKGCWVLDRILGKK